MCTCSVVDRLTLFYLVLCRGLLQLLFLCCGAAPLGVCLLVVVVLLCHALPRTPGNSTGQLLPMQLTLVVANAPQVCA